MTINIAVHVGDIFAVGEGGRCDEVGRTSGICVGIPDCITRETSREGLCMYHSRRRQKEELTREYGVEWGKSIPIAAGVKSLSRV